MKKFRLCRHTTRKNINWMQLALEKRWPTHDFVVEDNEIYVMAESDYNTENMRIFACGAMTVCEIMDAN